MLAPPAAVVEVGEEEGDGEEDEADPSSSEEDADEESMSNKPSSKTRWPPPALLLLLLLLLYFRDRAAKVPVKSKRRKVPSEKQAINNLPLGDKVKEVPAMNQWNIHLLRVWNSIVCIAF